MNNLKSWILRGLLVVAAAEQAISGFEAEARTIQDRFRAGDIDGLLFALRENFGIESHRSADDRIELKRRD